MGMVRNRIWHLIGFIINTVGFFEIYTTCSVIIIPHRGLFLSASSPNTSY